MDSALKEAQEQQGAANATGTRSFGSSAGNASSMTSLLRQVPGAGDLCHEAEQLQARSDAQERIIENSASLSRTRDTFQGPPGSTGGPPGPGVPGLSPNFDPKKTIAQIYPILEFRDKVVKLIDRAVEKIPGLEALVEKITDTVTLFVLSLLAPFIRPIINAVAMQLKAGSTQVVDASGKHQYGRYHYTSHKQSHGHVRTDKTTRTMDRSPLYRSYSLSPLQRPLLQPSQ